MQYTRWPAQWYNSDTGKVYKYGGWPYYGYNFSADLWSFEPGGATVYWSKESLPSTTGLSVGSNAPWGSAWTATDSTFYSLGGSIIGTGNYVPNIILSGLVEYDGSAGTWQNYSTSIPGSSPFINEAQAAFAPNFGKQGIITIVGGASPPQQTFVYEGGASLRDMSEILLYDPSSNTWYVQRATGDIPPPRTEFCAVGASSDGQTFEL